MRRMKLTAPLRTASPLSVARVVASLVTLGANAVMAYGVLTDDITLTLAGARIFVWSGLIVLGLLAIEWTGRKLRTLGGRR